MILIKPGIVSFLRREDVRFSRWQLGHAEVIRHLMLHAIIVEDVVKLLEHCVGLCLQFPLPFEMRCDESCRPASAHSLPSFH